MITVRFILYVVFWGYVARMIIIIRRQQENSLMLPYVMILMLGTSVVRVFVKIWIILVCLQLYKVCAKVILPDLLLLQADTPGDHRAGSPGLCRGRIG